MSYLSTADIDTYREDTHMKVPKWASLGGDSVPQDSTRMTPPSQAWQLR
jgi:hypothetical protein